MKIRSNEKVIADSDSDIRLSFALIQTFIAPFMVPKSFHRIQFGISLYISTGVIENDDCIHVENKRAT